MLEDTPEQMLREQNVKKNEMCWVIDNDLVWLEPRITG